MKANNFFTKSQMNSSVHKFMIDKIHLGFIRTDMLQALSKYANVFKITDDPKDGTVVTLVEELQTYDQRTKAINDSLLDMKNQNIFPFLDKWRNENLTVYRDNRAKPYFDMERAATGILGVLRSAVHVTGYTIFNDSYYIWIAKRSMNKATHPGLFDNMVGGSCNSMFSIYENAVKESFEEAGISEPLIGNLKPCGAISSISEDERGILPEIIYCYDILLPKDFMPENNDLEVESFELKSVEEVGHLMGKSCFKFNSALVMLDFYFRHGLITPDECSDYYNLYRKLHIKIPFDSLIGEEF